MDEILSISLSFPAVIFSVGLGVAAAYWLLVVLGAVDAEHHGAGHHGVGHGHAGHGHVGHGHMGHADLGAHDGHQAGVGDHNGLFDWLGFTGVPIMIPITFLMLFGWALSMLAVEWIPGVTSDGLIGTAVRVGVFAGAVVGAAPLAGSATRPFRRLFKTQVAVRRHALVGRRCVVTTGSVSETFGQAEVKDHGAGLLVAVRATAPNALVSGSEAVVVDYDPEADVFHIAAIPSSEPPNVAPFQDIVPISDRSTEST